MSEAAQAYSEAINLNENYSQVYFGRALCYEKMKKHSLKLLAENDFEMAFKLTPQLINAEVQNSPLLIKLRVSTKNLALIKRKFMNSLVCILASKHTFKLSFIIPGM